MFNCLDEVIEIYAARIFIQSATEVSDELGGGCWTSLEKAFEGMSPRGCGVSAKVVLGAGNFPAAKLPATALVIGVLCGRIEGIERHARRPDGTTGSGHGVTVGIE